MATLTLEQQKALAMAAARKRLAEAQQQAPAPSWRGGVAGGLLQGAYDPIQGSAQLLSHLAPDFISGPLTDMNNYLADKTGIFSRIEGGNLDQMISQGEREYQAARGADGRTGFDAARMIGNIISPANLAVGKALPLNPALGVPSLAARGAGYGALGGLMAPVTEGDYGIQKTLQTGAGAVTGAVLTPVIAKTGQFIAKKVNGLLARARPPQDAAQEAERIVAAALAETNQKASDLPPDYMDFLKAKVTESLKSGNPLDAAALLRQQDFRRLGTEGTLGQITRDPSQYAAERNLRGIAGVGEPLLNRFESQNKALQGAFANTADDAYNAGSALQRRLAKIDKGMSSAVSKAYTAARESSGASDELNLTGLAQDYADVLFKFGDKVPSGIRNQFDQYGLMTGKQAKIMTVNDAESLIKSINDHVGSDKATNTALGYLRNAVKKAVTDTSSDVFAQGRTLAKQRFGLLDAIPALKAASEGTADPDSFVLKYVINGKTDDVAGLAKILQGQPEFNETRAQIVQHLQRAAFGENPAGDAAFSPARYAQTLRKLGDGKLSSFFTPQEIDLFKTAGRVGAYINSHPVASPVNTSNTAAMVANLLRHTLGWTQIGNVASSVSQPVKNRIAVSTAMNAKVPTVSGMSPESMTFLRQLLAAGALGTAGASADDLVSTNAQ